MKRTILGVIGGLLVTGVLVWGQDGIAQISSKNSDVEVAMMAEDQGPWGRGMRMEHGMHMDRSGPDGEIPSELAEKMGLTDTQKNRMKALHTAFAKDMARLEADAEIARIDLRELMDQTSPGAAAVKSQANKVNEARGKIFERAMILQAEMKGVLTAEQQQMMQEERHEMRSTFRDREMRGQRGMRGPGFMRRGGDTDTNR